MVLTETIIEALRKRYANVPPLVFQRSVDRARNDTELFDILEGVPSGYPLVWCDGDRSWITARAIGNLEFRFRKD
jgi:hypothetical protein